MRADPITGRRWWVIGASAGLGRAIALELAAGGASVIASARNARALEALAREVPAIAPLPMDVTSDASVRAACDEVGAPYGIIYAAGAYAPMSARNWLPGQAETMAEVNFVGALRVLSHVLPEQVAAREGRVVLIGSLAGFRGLPGAIGYGASKAALMHLAENLRADLGGTGVRAQIINPGFIRTRLTAKNTFAMPQIMEPDAAAGRVLAAIRKGRFATSFPAPFAWIFTIGRHLPLALFQAMFGRAPGFRDGAGNPPDKDPAP
ncbi:MAG: SDR family NAD(P)-dependent oxidoreductase [Alphaproteobacteria bacterium]|nr:MAG: SDR family NAD(P)-dependent oxidoreductase [Alphaproteobacteria bacterium]